MLISFWCTRLGQQEFAYCWEQGCPTRSDLKSTKREVVSGGCLQKAEVEGVA